MKKLNKDCDERYCKEMFNEIDADGSGKLEYSEFLRLMKKINSKPELQPYFDHYAEPYTGPEE
jgi:Ca2+-binding EF-hand superfamily protein